MYSHLWPTLKQGSGRDCGPCLRNLKSKDVRSISARHCSERCEIVDYRLPILSVTPSTAYSERPSRYHCCLPRTSQQHLTSFERKATMSGSTRSLSMYNQRGLTTICGQWRRGPCLGGRYERTTT
ncbi:uncharacterized protein LOC128546538 [Mercenaria mercenaria]|uniref:uncharacterized protein LOC128546538 n=1 Tax=Mercenaria mercenaria TaxID=6596 RepID=UPI00234F6B46|nr:uncharacterized protein LOC128546538 [Mercenaria mercenaria]